MAETIESQIAFLKECYQVATRGYINEDEVIRRRAKRGMSNLQSTIELLEKLNSAEPAEPRPHDNLR